MTSDLVLDALNAIDSPLPNGLTTVCCSYGQLVSRAQVGRYELTTAKHGG